MAHNEENLHTLISTDLEYLNAWSYRWLVKFNPNKTDIMIFSTAFKYSKSVLINVCKFSSLCAIWPIQVSSANSLPKPDILSATSFIKIRKSNGPKTDPWGTPAFNSPVLDIASLITTRCFRLEKKQITSITFADISKAFDTVWIKALILKLENYGIKGKLLF
jgi:hypothetical protein